MFLAGASCKSQMPPPLPTTVALRALTRTLPLPPSPPPLPARGRDFFSLFFPSPWGCAKYTAPPSPPARPAVRPIFCYLCHQEARWVAHSPHHTIRFFRQNLKIVDTRKGGRAKLKTIPPRPSQKTSPLLIFPGILANHAVCWAGMLPLCLEMASIFNFTLRRIPEPPQARAPLSATLPNVGRHMPNGGYT